MTLIPNFEASQCNSKVSEKSGKTNTGAVVSFLILSNDEAVSSVHSNLLSRIQSMIGAIMLLNYETNRR